MDNFGRPFVSPADQFSGQIGLLDANFINAAYIKTYEP